MMDTLTRKKHAARFRRACARVALVKSRRHLSTYVNGVAAAMMVSRIEHNLADQIEDAALRRWAHGRIESWRGADLELIDEAERLGLPIGAARARNIVALKADRAAEGAMDADRAAAFRASQQDGPTSSQDPDHRAQVVQIYGRNAQL